jgi:hypothetical protein
MMVPQLEHDRVNIMHIIEIIKLLFCYYYYCLLRGNMVALGIMQQAGRSRV